MVDEIQENKEVEDPSVLDMDEIQENQETSVLDMDEIQENKEVEVEYVLRRHKKPQKEVEDSYSDLPEEILCLIKSNLFGRDYDVFGAVCRSWQLTPEPVDSSYRCSPCLILINRENYMSIFFHPLYSYSYSMDIPELYNSCILASNYGWLLLYFHRYHLLFFNPYTREKIELPDLKKYYHSWSFTSPPTSDDCLVIGFTCYGRDSFIGILRRGQRCWDAHSYTNEFFMVSNGNPVLCNKLYYVLGIGGSIGVFDLDKLTWNVFLTQYAPEVEYFGRSFFVEDGGRLVVAFLSRDYNNEVRFLSLGLTNMVWEVEQSIGDKTMYASCASTFFKRGVNSPMSNKICLPFYSGQKLVLYCLANKRFHQFDGECSTKKLMREKYNAWIEPNFERAGHEKLVW